MLVDTNAIRALGAECSARADDLSSAAAALTTWPGPDTAAALGAVGDRFLATLTDAVLVEARAIAALSDDLTTTHAMSGLVAGEYADADRRGSRLL
jgi:hypothetical protein